MTIQLVSAAQVANSPGRPGVIYVLNVPPHTAYVWDGSEMRPASGFSTAQVAAVLARTPGFASVGKRVFALLDSIGHRQFLQINGASPVNSGTDVTIAASSQGLPVGSLARLVNVPKLREYKATIVASDAAGFTLRYPFDISAVSIVSPSVYAEAKLSDSGWINYALAALAERGTPAALFYTAAVGGAKIAEMRARFESEIVPLGPQPGDILICGPTINDIEATATDTIVSELSQLYDRALKFGMIVHTGVITQVGASSYFTTPATALTQILDVNQAVINKARSKPNMRVFRGDLALGGGSYATAGTTEAAGSHPTPAGAAPMGARYITDCGDDYPRGEVYRYASNADNWVNSESRNKVANCQFAGASGAAPGTGWTATGTGNTFTSDALGLNWTKAAAGTNSSTVVQDVTARLTAGETYEFGNGLEVLSVGQGHYFRAELVFIVGGIEYAYTIGRNQFTVAQNGGSLPPVGTKWLNRHTALVPVGFTQALLRFSLQQVGVGSTQIRVSEPVIFT